MIVGLIISGAVVIGVLIGAGWIIREQLNRQDKRIDMLLRFIRPEVYRKNKISEDLQRTLFRGPKKEIHDPVAEELSRGGG